MQSVETTTSVNYASKKVNTTDVKLFTTSKKCENIPELALVLSNLVCVCKVHHNREHPEKLQKQKKKFENEERW
ncbi:hypothetical protein ACN95B_002798 [Listeria monocytogenes]